MQILNYTYNPNPVHYQFTIRSSNGFTLITTENNNYTFNGVDYCIVRDEVWVARSKKNVDATKKIGGISQSQTFHLRSDNIEDKLKSQRVSELFRKSDALGALYLSKDKAIEKFESGFLDEEVCRLEYDSMIIFDIEGLPARWQPIWYDYISAEVTDGKYAHFRSKVVPAFEANPRVLDCKIESIGWYNSDCGSLGLTFNYLPTDKERREAWAASIPNNYPALRYKEYFFGYSAQIDPCNIKQFLKPDEE